MADGNAKTRALLVEDDPNIVDLIWSNLVVRGFEVIVSPDGSRVAAVLVNGYATTKAAQEHGSATVFTTMQRLYCAG